MKKINTLVAASTLLFAQSALSASVLSGQGGASGGSSHVPLVAFAKTASDAGVAEIQVTDGNTLTKAAIALATGKTDMAVLPVSVLGLLNNGAGPYKKMGKEKSGALKANLRQIFGYQAGYYTFISFADSGVESLEDFKGKKVHVGPPSGSASVNSIGIIKAATGFEAGKDYEAVKMGWGAVQQSFTDRKVDVMMRSGPWPNALFSQLVSSGDLRVFGMPEAIANSQPATKAGQKLVKVPTESLGEGFTFTNEIDGQVNQVSYMMSLNVHKSMSDDQAYALTKAFFERYDSAMKAAAWMEAMGINKVVSGLEKVGGKLHPGAIRYYKEAGVEIPESLM